MLDFQCKYCESDIQADYPYIGEFVECPVCGEVVVVPDPLLSYGSDYHGYVIERLRASTLLWNTYQVTPVNAELNKLNQALLRIPGAFFLKRLTYFEKFCEIVVRSGSLGIKGIAPLVDHSVVQGKTYFIFEFFPSTDLNVFIAKNGPLDMANSLRIIRRCAVALREAWNEDEIIHQNILPHNIRINEQREIRLMNLGLSQFLLEDKNLLEEGFNIWDQRYISQEFALRGDGDSPSCDIYALGMVLFFLLTGNHPYSLMPEENIPHSPLPDLKGEVPDISDDVVALFQLMVAKRLSLRFSDWSEVLERIDAILHKFKKRSESGDFGRFYSNVKTRTDRRKPIALAPMVAVSTEKFKRSRPKKRKQEMSDTIARPVNHNKKTHHIQSVMRNTRRKRGFFANNVGLVLTFAFFSLFAIAFLLFWMMGESEKKRVGTKAGGALNQTLSTDDALESDSSAFSGSGDAPSKSKATPAQLLRRHLNSALKYLKEHPDDFDGSLKRLEAVIPKAVNLKRFDIVNVIREKTDLLSARKASLEEDGVRDLMTRLRKSVEPYLKSGEYGKAEKIVDEYDGPLKLESRFPRKRLRDEIKSMRAGKIAALDRDNDSINHLARRIAPLLISGKLIDAKNILEETGSAKETRQLSSLTEEWLAGVESYEQWRSIRASDPKNTAPPEGVDSVATLGQTLAQGLMLADLGEFDAAKIAFKKLRKPAVETFLTALKSKRLAVHKESMEKKLIDEFSLILKKYSLRFDKSSPSDLLSQLGKARISRQNAKKLASEISMFAKRAVGSGFIKDYAHLVEALLLFCKRKSGGDSEISLDIVPQKILSPADNLNEILISAKSGTSIKLGKGTFKIGRVAIFASRIALSGVDGAVLTGGPLIINGAKCSLSNLEFKKLDITFSKSPWASIKNCRINDGDLKLIGSKNFVMDNTFLSSMSVKNSDKLKISHCTFASIDPSVAPLRIDTKELRVVDSIVYGRGIAILLLQDGTKRKCKFEHTLIFGEKWLAARDRGTGFFEKRDFAPTKSRIRRFIKTKDNIYSPPQFMNHLKGDWRLVPKVPGAKSSSDGKDRGVVWPAVD